MGQPFVERAGETYGRLTVIAYRGVSKKPGKYRLWLCRCECGQERIISYRELARGHTQSCGCLFRETLAGRGGMNRKPFGFSSFQQLFGSYRRSARTRGHEFSLGEEEFRHLTSQPCHYCGVVPSQRGPAVKGTNGSYVYNGVDRIDNAQGYRADNVRPCCKRCNVAKASMGEAEFRNWVAAVAQHLGL